MTDAIIIPFPESQSHEERFWAKVDTSGECWTWTACLKSNGYGSFRLLGSMRLAHRVAYEMEVGPIPEGMQIDHKCHNRACVRPEHLRLATHAQNQANRSGAAASSKSGIRGVYWHSDYQKWTGQVRHNGYPHRGSFDTLEEATAWVEAKRAELFGEFGETL